MVEGWGTLRRAIVAITLGIASACDEESFEPRDTRHPSSEAQPRAGEQYAPCGTPLAEVDGVWAYSNGPYTGTGTECIPGPDAIGAYRYQCVEFAQRYMHEIFGLAPRWNVGAAKQMCSSYPAGVSPQPAGATPVHGDLAVFTHGDWGHVAVVAEVFADGIAIVEQNSSASGYRVLHGDPWNGYWTDYGTSPSCFMHADDNEGTPTVEPPPPAPTGAQCDALGYAGECRGSTSVWSEGGACFVRDCASEGRECGFISDDVGWGCLGGTVGSTGFDCAQLDYSGRCLQDGTLAWVEHGECKVVHCPASGRGCAWDEQIGYNCM